MKAMAKAMAMALPRACGESAIALERCAREAEAGLWMPNGIPNRLISLFFEV
jgi:hypothetical protein